MTVSHALNRRASLPASAGTVCFGSLLVFCLFLLLRNPEVAVSCLFGGLSLAAKTVVPSLFPFLVLSEMIVSSGVGDALGRLVAKPVKLLYGLPEAGGCVLLLGLICGFPVGARCTVSAYRAGKLTKRQAEHVLSFSNNPSAAFLINAVGVSLWHDRRIGAALFAAVTVSALLAGILMRFVCRARPESASPVPEPAPPLPTPPSVPRLFASAVSSATRSALLVSAYVAFFSALLGTLGNLLAALNAPRLLTLSLYPLLELSGGLHSLTSLPLPTALFASASAAAWSGASVLCQILSSIDRSDLSITPLLLSKTIQSALCPIVFWIIY